MTSYILPFQEINGLNIGEVGGKGANLGELTQAGFDVPSGFCVTTSAFARFMAEAPKDIYAALEQNHLDDLNILRQVGTKVRSELEKIEFPPEVSAELVKAWKESGEDLAYAVRSSATAEDLPHASFAGQQDTYLNVRGEKDLIVKVKACFISLFTDRAILYRVQNNFDHKQVALSVVVQEMVQPEVAGILFTADPISGHRQIASIDASFGLGEALVSGLVSADLYQVDKRTSEIVKRQIATKKMAIRSLPAGGTEEVKLGPDESDLPALNDLQIIKLATLGTKIEAHYGHPQDIEWALVGDKLYVTQSRPITSLYPLVEPPPDDGALHVYTSLSHFQVMTDTMPLLSISLLQTFLPFGRDAGAIESEFVHPVGGRMYADVSPLLRHPIGKRLLIKAYASADLLAQGALKELSQRPQFLAKGPRYSPLALIPAAWPYLRRMLNMLTRGEPEPVPAESAQRSIDHLYHIEAELKRAIDVKDKLRLVVHELQEAMHIILTWVPAMIAGVAAAGILKSLIGRWADADDLAALERGLIGNVTTEMNLAAGDLTDAARKSAELKSLLSRSDLDTQARLTQAADLPGGDQFLEEWTQFLKKYGSRALSEIDLSRPRWSEDPTALLQMVVNGLDHGEARAHRAHFEHLKQEGDQAADKLLKQAQVGLMGWLRGPIVGRLIRVSRALLPLREHHKFLVVQMLGLFKPVLLEAGERLADKGIIDHRNDVWFLSLPELIEASEKLEDRNKVWQSLVEKRQEAFERYQHMTPPRVMTSDGEIPVMKLEGVDAPEGALLGSPVSAGVIEGIAKVVLDPSKESLIPGEILVAPFTDPGWTPLFVNAAGLITEVGGLMTHGSVVAREYGIPAVVGVLDATKQIQSGQRVRVHGDVGYIELLDNLDEVNER